MINVNEFMDGLGKQVRFHRMKAGLTQVQLANMAGVGKTTVFDIEKGKTSVRIDSLLAVLRIVNIDIQFSGPLSMEYEKLLECEKY
jgi:y4mF family transcriptional regulator